MTPIAKLVNCSGIAPHFHQWQHAYISVKRRISLLNSQLHQRKTALLVLPEAPSSHRVRISQLFDYCGKYLC